MIRREEWKDGDVIQLLVGKASLGELMEDWLWRSDEADVRVRRAKTEGCVVIETRYPLYAAFVVKHYKGVEVNIKKQS